MLQGEGAAQPEDTALIDTIIEDERWGQLALGPLAERAARATLERLGHDPGAYEIVVLGADDARVAALNRQFRGKADPTNVLSWPSVERSSGTPGHPPAAPTPGELGDIALAWETCTREADALGRPIGAHVTHLVVHGALHLLGFGHETEPDALLMEALESEILASLGLPDPYS